jgi:PAS domain S-box-containing protein
MFILKVIKDEFYVVSTNEAQQEAVSIENLDHFDKPLSTVLPADIYNFVVPNYKRCIEQQSPIQYEESEAFTSGDGSTRHWSTMLSPINNDEGITEYIFGISRNITELKNAKQAAEDSAREAEKANRVKTTFLANMSHEMRTPLNGIQCALELLKETDDKNEKAELISIIESSADALSRQTSDILEYAKIGRGKIVLQAVNFSPAALLMSVVKIISTSATAKGLSLNTSIQGDLPALVQGDPDRIKQVLLNLANNAIKFTDHGSISIALEYQSEQQELKFSVQDTGIGIQENDQKKLFKPFSQVDDSSTRQFEGNGLGLVISKELVEMMGGKINLTSNFHKGTLCTFNIPYKEAKVTKEETASANPLQLDHIHILVVEDNLTNQKVLEKILRQTGARVSIAIHGKQALDMCQGEHYHLVLMDWHMPVLDGLAATRALRQLTAYADTPILGLTASVLDQDIKSCKDSGMNDVITKPINREKLFNSLAYYLELNPQYLNESP